MILGYRMVTMRKIYFIALLLVVLDRLCKLVVAGNMVLGQSIPLISGVLHITYIKNTGAAFGILPGQQWFLIIVSTLVVVALLVFAHKLGRSLLVQLSLALMIGGATGNLLDRLFLGWVIDFIDFRIWPVFNLADIALVMGVGLLLTDMYLDWKGSRA